jgi:hypothetical protein
MSARLNPGGGGSRGQVSNPMGRAGRMPELANLAVYLLHPLSEYVNGQTVAIDGGGWNAGGGNLAYLHEWNDARWAEAKAMIRGSNEQDRAKRTV